MEELRIAENEFINMSEKAPYVVTEEQMNDPYGTLTEFLELSGDEYFLKFKLSESWRTQVLEEHEKWLNLETPILNSNSSLKEIGRNIFQLTRRFEWTQWYKWDSDRCEVGSINDTFKEASKGEDIMSTQHLNHIKNRKWYSVGSQNTTNFDTKIPIFDTNTIQKWNFNNLNPKIRNFEVLRSSIGQNYRSIGIQGPIYSCWGGGFMSPIRSRDYEFPFLDHQLKGNGKYYIIVPRSQWERFHNILNETLKEIFPMRHCSDIWRRELVILSTDFWSENQVPVSLVQLREGETMMIGPGTFYSTINTDYTANISVNFAFNNFGHYAHYYENECPCGFHKNNLPRLQIAEKMRVWCKAPLEITNENGIITTYHPHDPRFAETKRTKKQNQLIENVGSFREKQQRETRLDPELLSHLARYLLHHHEGDWKEKTLMNKFKTWFETEELHFKLPKINVFNRRIEKQFFLVFLRGENDFGLDENEKEQFRQKINEQKPTLQNHV